MNSSVCWFESFWLGLVFRDFFGLIVWRMFNFEKMEFKRRFGVDFMFLEMVLRWSLELNTFIFIGFVFCYVKY